MLCKRILVEIETASENEKPIAVAPAEHEEPTPAAAHLPLVINFRL